MPYPLLFLDDRSCQRSHGTIVAWDRTVTEAFDFSSAQGRKSNAPNIPTLSSNRALLHVNQKPKFATGGISCMSSAVVETAAP